MARSYGRSLRAAIGLCLGCIAATVTSPAPGPAATGRAFATAVPTAPTAPVAPAVTTDIAALLREVRRSVSAGGDIRAIRFLRTEADVFMGGQVVGRVETLAAREPRALREVLDVAGVRQAVTVLGDEVWLESPNSSVRRATGDEVVTALLSHTLLFHLYLEGDTDEFELVPTPDGFEFRTASGSRIGSGPTLALARREDRGEGLLLPHRWRQRQHGVDATTTFDDWRVVGGVRFPFLATMSTGDPRFDMTMRTLSWEILERLPENAIVAPGESNPDFEITDPKRAANLEVELLGSLALISVSVDGAPGWFLIDTGAGATVIGTSFAKKLGLASRGIMEARGAGGSEAASFVEVESLGLPGVILHDQILVSVPLEGISSILDRSLDGVLGYDFLSRFAVEIDYPQRRLSLVPSGEYHPRESAVRVGLRIEMNVPRVEGVLEGEHRGAFLIDTGNNRGLLLHSPFALANGFDERATDSGDDVAGIGGRESVREVTVSSLALGDAVFRDVPAFFSSSTEGIVAIEEAIGNVGSALFTGGVLAFDYSEGSLWISPRPISASTSNR